MSRDGWRGGGPKGGSIVDPNYLDLVSDQHLRTTVIVGRPDLGKPDWRANVPGHPMSPQDIADVVAWLAAQRQRLSRRTTQPIVHSLQTTNDRRGTLSNNRREHIMAMTATRSRAKTLHRPASRAAAFLLQARRGAQRDGRGADGGPGPRVCLFQLSPQRAVHSRGSRSARSTLLRRARPGWRRIAIRYTRPWDGATADIPCWVRRIEGEKFQIFAINCTHLGCPVRWFQESHLFMCPCHGGAFYEDGSHASGPPPRGLYEYEYKIEHGATAGARRATPDAVRAGLSQRRARVHRERSSIC